MAEQKKRRKLSFTGKVGQKIKRKKIYILWRWLSGIR